MGAQREIEAKLEVPPGAAMPDLAGLPGVVAVDPPQEFTLDAVYWDTPDLRLARARTTLRRRAGGTDAGWHLKLPVSADERIELTAPLGAQDGDVPAELLAVVRVRVRESQLEPVVELQSRRTVYRLRDALDRVLAEVADDAVTSRAPGAGDDVVDAWREWEVELVDGDRDLLAAAVLRLKAGGGAVPAWTSKLARALGDRLVAADGAAGSESGTEAVTEPANEPATEPATGPAAGGPGTVPDPRSAAAVLTEHLRAVRDLLLSRDPRVRRGQPDAVHQFRVAVGRLRNALATFRPLLVRTRSEAVRVELGWLAALLGAAHDADVSRERLAALVAGEPAELIPVSVARHLDRDRADALAVALDQVREALDSPRYFQLLDALDDLVDAPPFTKLAAERATRVLPLQVRHEWEQLAHAYEAARDVPAGPNRDRLLHEAHRRAKRARHAAEALVPSVGRQAEKFAQAAKTLQTLLGHHHDYVELRATLQRAAVQAHLDGENVFSYGRLHALEQARAERIENRLPAAWARVSSVRRRRWMY
jgi:CHAD domain-containing protein